MKSVPAGQIVRHRRGLSLLPRRRQGRIHGLLVSGEPAEGGRAAPSPQGGGSKIGCVMSVERGLCLALTSSKPPPWFPGVRMMWRELLSPDRCLASPRIPARLSSTSARPNLLHAWIRQEQPSDAVDAFTPARLCSSTGAE